MNNETQAAEFLTIEARTLQSWRGRGYGVRFLKIGRLIRYRQHDLDAWLEAQVRESTSDTGEGK